uniref:P2X purinoceptor n=1 Tax=Anas zonorhyncha TaxID=75864 RepID=A0A8B9UVL8_9AVES
MGYQEGGITGQRTEGADHPRPTAGSPHPRAQSPVPQGDGGARRPPQEAGGRADAAGPARCQVRAPPSRSGGCQRAGRTERGSESFTRSLRGARGLLRRHLVSRCGAPHCCCCCWWWCCHGGGAVLRVAGLQDREIRPDTEPAGRAAAPPAAARCLGLPARVGAGGAEGLPGHGRGPSRLGHHQDEGGLGHTEQGREQPALGCGRLCESSSGGKRGFSGHQLHCHSQASPRHLPRGIKTGKCVMFNATHSTCEIYGWCPVENNTLPRKPLLAEAENFTLFIKNTVNFTKFNFSKGNTLQTNDSTYFKSCTYDPFFNPSCPVFRIGDVVEAAGETFGDLALLGGSISIRIEWNCDLDQPSARCQPQYSFILVDRRYNFRTASYYWDSQRRPYRSLMKLYGIRFDISVHGQATVVCDLVLLYLDTQADFYWKEKFEEAKPPKGKTEAAADPQWADQDIRNAQ